MRIRPSRGQRLLRHRRLFLKANLHLRLMTVRQKVEVAPTGGRALIQKELRKAAMPVNSRLSLNGGL